METGTTAENSEANDSKHPAHPYPNGGESPRRRQIMTYALWIVQGLLALIFLYAGGIKLVLPIEVMTEQMPVALPGWFLRFIGVAEVLGAIGLILPGLLGIRPGLTPLAAAGLMIIMIGATVLTLVAFGPDGVALALIPLVVGLLSAFVAYGRRRQTKALSGKLER